jgi:hypothetical protein
VAIIWDSYVPPAALTTFVRDLPLRQDYVLSQVFPNRNIADTEVNFDDVTVTTRAAKYRAWDAPPLPIKRDSFVTKKVKLPPVSTMLGMGERERLDIERLRNGGQNRQAAINAIFDDAAAATRAVQARVELARGDLLQDGKVTISEAGLVMEADFGVPGGNIATAGTLWTNPAADVLGDLRTWSQAYRTTNGFLPGGMIMSETVMYNMLANTAIKNLYSSTVGAPSILSIDQLDNTLRSYGLPTRAFTYDAQVDVDGTTTSILPTNKVFFVPPAGTELGYTAFGLTVTGMELANAGVLSFDAAPGLVGVLEKDDRPPYRQTTYVDATALPVLTNPRALAIFTVG